MFCALNGPPGKYDGGDAIVFDTEDSDVRELIRKLSLVFKDLYIDYLWASEDIGVNMGSVQYRDGRGSHRIHPNTRNKSSNRTLVGILGARALITGLI